MKNFMNVLMITVVSSSGFFATAAYADLSRAELDKLKKECISIGKRIGVRADGSYGCGSEPSVTAGDHTVSTEIKKLETNKELAPVAKATTKVSN